MYQPEFEATIEEQVDRSKDMLVSKNDHYNPGDDKLRAFKVAAAIKNEPVKTALAGMMVKHTTSIYDMCMSEDDFSIEVWNEKITDNINYLLLLRAVIEEERIDQNRVAIQMSDSPSTTEVYRNAEKALQQAAAEGCL